MTINILAFGQIAEVCKKSHWTVSDIASTETLLEKLTTEFPELKKMTFSVSVNKTIINSTMTLSDSDTVALLPPFSGG